MKLFRKIYFLPMALTIFLMSGDNTMILTWGTKRTVDL